MRYADVTIDERRGRLVCVCEDHRGAGEAENTIVAVPLAGGDPEVLVRGADFYAAPRMSPDGARLAYVCWRHPHMPWQSTRLFVANIDGAGRLGAPTLVAGAERESVQQPVWSPDGRLAFVSDRSGFWNIYLWAGADPEEICPVDAELCSAPWGLGLATYGWLGPDTLACAVQRAGFGTLGVIDTRTRRLTQVETGLSEIAHVKTAGGRAVFAGGAAAEPTGIYALESGTLTLLARPSPLPVSAACLSRPQALSFETHGDSQGDATGASIAHGLYYPPHNPDFEGLPGERPPLVVVCHGGPTGAASTSLNLALQFWTSRGFAVLDVNYRGSTGYGRAFREALDGRWGLADVEDCIAGARALVERGLADAQRLVIRGGSAGGYTTLAALTFHDVFRAGASYYGVSDLEALARDTHKFESRYLDTLVAPYPAGRDVYLARSPLYHADRLSCPVIFFQGLEDKVVPPDQAERMVLALRRKGIAAEYMTFPDEQHGFRRAENVVRALEAELAFTQRVLGLADPRPG